MREKDGDTWFCYYAVMKLRWKPSEFAFLPRKERAIMYAFIQERMKEEEAQSKKLKSAQTRRRGHR